MGFFDRFFKKAVVKDDTFTPASDLEGWVGILYACFVADDNADEEETQQLVKVLLNEDKFAGVNFVKMHHNVANAEIDLGPLELVKACAKVIKQEDKERVFRLAMDIVLSDGLLDEDEQKVVDAIANELDLTIMVKKKIMNDVILFSTGRD